jgi:hypothetical protein
MAAGDGLVSMTPTSIAHSGTSASINADGGVDFTAVTSLSLNDVFTSDHDNYLIVIRYVAAFGDPRSRLRMRVAGTDATGSNYVRQVIDVNGGSIAKARATESAATIGEFSSTQRSGENVHMYGPFLAQPTAMRGVNAGGFTSARLTDNACTHSLSTSYDGFTFYPESSDMTGNIHVFGYEE